MNFPKTTEFNKKVPKQRFYENLSVTPAIKKIFVEQIQSIVWANKLAVNTLNVQAGEYVTEIQILKIYLHTDKFDVSVLKQIDKVIPYNNIYMLVFEDKYQIWLRYKDLDGSITKYFNTDWLNEDEIPLKIDGLSLDTVYENFVSQISGIKRTADAEFSEQIKINEKIKKLEKEIARLEKQARAEKQPKKKFELAGRVNALKKELEQSEVSFGQNDSIQKEVLIPPEPVPEDTIPQPVEEGVQISKSDTVKALSILPEYAAAIFDGIKTVEWRSWKTDYRGDLLICASSRKHKGCISGHALCMVTLKDVVPFRKKHLEGALMRWKPSPEGYAWILENVRQIKPFPYKGKLHIYDVDASLVEVMSPIGTKEADEEFNKYYKPLLIEAGADV